MESNVNAILSIVPKSHQRLSGIELCVYVFNIGIVIVVGSDNVFVVVMISYILHKSNEINPKNTCFWQKCSKYSENNNAVHMYYFELNFKKIPNKQYYSNTHTKIQVFDENHNDFIKENTKKAFFRHF